MSFRSQKVKGLEEVEKIVVLKTELMEGLGFLLMTRSLGLTIEIRLRLGGGKLRSW